MNGWMNGWMNEQVLMTILGHGGPLVKNPNNQWPHYVSKDMYAQT